LNRDSFNRVVFKNTKWPMLDQNFLASMYTQSVGFDLVQHQKFVDDINNMTRRRKDQERHQDGHEFNDTEFTD